MVVVQSISTEENGMPTSEPSTFTQKSAEELERENVLRRQEKLRALEQQKIEERARRLYKQLYFKGLYQNETLEQKVQRLAGNIWLDYDQIRWVVETDLVLENPTPARIRERRESIARLISDYRHRSQWQNQPKPSPMTQEERRTLRQRGASLMHPDRAKNEADRLYRNTMMGLFNQAYNAGDEERMRDLLHEYELESKATTGEEQETRPELA